MPFTRLTLPSLFAAFALAACTHTVEGPGDVGAAPGLAEELAALQIGRYRTSPDDPDNDFRDIRLALDPLGPGAWLYTHLNTGPEQTTYRQRVVQLVPRGADEVVQQTYSLQDAAAAGDLLNDAAARRALRLEALTDALGPGCEMVWTRRYDDPLHAWTGKVDAGTCHIYSERRQGKIAIGAESRLGSDELWQTEKGYLLDGTQLFGGPDGTFIKLYREPAEG